MLSKSWRFIICTSDESDILIREKTGKTKNKNLKKLKNQLLEKNFASLILSLAAALLISLSAINSNELFLGVNKAYAAESLANFDLAKQVVREIKPQIVSSQSAHNGLSVKPATDGFLSKPLIAETQITKEDKPVVQKRALVKKEAPVRATKAIGTLTANRFPYGYCTYYVSERRFIPWSGNAISWLSGAATYGYATGDTPEVGAIVVTSEGGRTGHVAMVDAVKGDQITLSEMNYRGFGVISTRTISSSYRAIMGYIY